MTLTIALDTLETAVAAGTFNGYGPRPIPHELDREPEQVVLSYVEANPSEKELVVCLSSEAIGVLFAYAESQAALAVRAGSESNLGLSLLALGVAVTATDDERQGMLVMPLPWRSSELLEVEPRTAFSRAAELLPTCGRNALLEFASRPPEDQTLECMGYEEGTDNDGFRYRRTW